VHGTKYTSEESHSEGNASLAIDQQSPSAQAGVAPIDEQWAADARPLLPKAAFFLGDLRDGLPMVRKGLAVVNDAVACLGPCHTSRFLILFPSLSTLAEHAGGLLNLGEKLH
jgi:hypothetical protein